MRLLLALVVTTAAWCWVAANGPLRFDNFQVYRVTPRTPKQIETLKKLEENPHGYSFWSDVRMPGQPVDIMVPPHLKYDFEDFLKLENLNGGVWIENVQNLIDNERSKVVTKDGGFNWEDYHTLEEINNWLDSLVERYPKIVSSIVGGESYEGRQIRGVKVSFGSGKRGAFIESGIHAREHIAPATVTYMLNEFLSSNNASVRRVAESRDWYFFPSVNPDGYVYSFTHNRMWRKTRKPYEGCYGADGNRNWGYHWMDGGASSYPCSETHAGDAAFSEIETKSLSEFINTVADTLDSYLAFHSYSQLFLIPFGHQGLEVPNNNDELHRIGKAAAESLSVRYGTEYRVGNIPEAIYVASGGSMDWALGVHRNIRIAYTYELRDTGRYGFILPAEQIIPTAEETLDSIVRMFNEADSV